MIEVSENHVYTIDGKECLFPSVTEVLSKTGFIDSRWFTEYARQRGTFVHDIVSWYLLKELDADSVDPALQGYFDAWVAFEKDTGFTCFETEHPKININYGYVGKPDLMGTMGKHFCVIDVKTGQIMPWTALQLAGYEMLYDMPKKRFALHLKENGKYSLKEFTDRKDKNIFLAALSCYHWQQNHK